MTVNGCNIDRWYHSQDVFSFKKYANKTPWEQAASRATLLKTTKQNILNKYQARQLERCDWLTGSRMATPTYMCCQAKEILQTCVTYLYLSSVCSYGNQIKDTCGK